MARKTTTFATIVLLCFAVGDRKGFGRTRVSTPADSVARSVFTTAIVNREPVDSIDTLYTDVRKVFYFSDVRGMTGKTVMHLWIYDGEVIFQKSFAVKGPRWRVNTSKTLLPEWTGVWKVQVADGDSNLLHEDSFIYLPGDGRTPLKTGSPSSSKGAKPIRTGPPDSTRSGAIERAQFTSGVVNREPVDDLSSTTTDIDQMFYFSEVRNMQGRTVTHRWLYGGEIKAEVPFKIGGPRWRVYSRKKILATWSGTWTVQVVDETGRILREDSFDFQANSEN